MQKNMRARYALCAVLLTGTVVSLLLVMMREISFIFIGLTFGCLGLIWLVWRCPQCSEFLGSIEAKVCRHCKTSLYGSSDEERKASYTDKMRIAANLERRNKIMRHIGSLQRLTRAVWISYIGTAIVMALARGLDYFHTPWWALAGIGTIGYLVIQVVTATAHNLLAMQFKCLACEKSLAGQTGPNCPFCGYKMQEQVEVDLY